MFGLSLDKMVIGGVLGALAISCIFWAGNVYGPNGHWRSNREAEDRAKNAVLTDLAEREDTTGADFEVGLSKLDGEFAGMRVSVAQCALDLGQAGVLSNRAIDLNRMR